MFLNVVDILITGCIILLMTRIFQYKQVNRNRAMAILLSTLLFLSVLVSTLFIVKELDHECVGENCPICYQISMCVDILKTITGAAIIASLVSTPFLKNISKKIFVKINLIYNTPVLLKVKLTI